MNVRLEMPDNAVAVFFTLISWVIVIGLLIRQYIKLERRPAIWKMLLAAIFGLFSFSIPLQVFGNAVKLAILPLGVWILYAFLRNRSWATYRRFAWIGFWSNFIFLTATLLSLFIHQEMYTRSDPATYAANVDQAELIQIHPSATAASFDKEAFQTNLKSLTAAPMDVFTWHYESRFEQQPSYQQEKFPYALIGAKPKWGSGLTVPIYIEADGKGLLITSEDRHYYYRSETPLIELEGVQ